MMSTYFLSGLNVQMTSTSDPGATAPRVWTSITSPKSGPSHTRWSMNSRTAKPSSSDVDPFQTQAWSSARLRIFHGERELSRVLEVVNHRSQLVGRRKFACVYFAGANPLFGNPDTFTHSRIIHRLEDPSRRAMICLGSRSHEPKHLYPSSGSRPTVRPRLSTRMRHPTVVLHLSTSPPPEIHMLGDVSP